MPTLHWLCREATLKQSSQVPCRVFQEVELLSSGVPSENMLIQGDNLHALKALLPYYRGAVKCIFIDPPYNTRSAFEHYQDSLEHSKWLDMMVPRLELLRELLAEDGSIWVTIDDHEAHYLKVVMDEIFGRGNFVANCIWQKKYTIANDTRWLSNNHDHVLIYARNKERWLPNKLPRTAEMNARYKNPDGHPKGAWKATPLHAKSGSANSIFSYVFKNGTVWEPPAGTFARFSKENLRRMDEADEIWFGKNGESTPSRKTFLSDISAEGTPSPTVWLHQEAGNNHEAREEVKALNSLVPFSTPKPERLIKRVLELATQENDLVLDSFLGSGTTAAVAHKMGRRYIGIEMGEHAKTHCAVRLKKVIEGEPGGISKAVNWQGGGGFRFYTLGAELFAADGSISPEVRFTDLAAYLWFYETHTGWHGAQVKGQGRSPLLGVHQGTAYYLLYNGILKDRSAGGGNILTQALLSELLAPEDPAEAHSGPRVIYGNGTRLGAKRLAAEGVLFKQIPYQVRAELEKQRSPRCN